MKRIVLFVSLLLAVLPLAAQKAGGFLKPDYRRIAKEVRKPAGPFFLDTLEARFSRCDTALDVDQLRCLYFSGAGPSIADVYRRYMLLVGRLGFHGGRANDTWTQYQMLLSAVWSTGDASRSHPLHVADTGDAAHIIACDGHGDMTCRQYRHRRYMLLCYEANDTGDYDVWFYIRRKKK